MHDCVDVLDVEERIEDARRGVELDEPTARDDAPHLRFEVVPLLCAVEVLEHREAALQEIGRKRLRLTIGEIPEAGLPHERHRVLEQLRIVERENQAAVGANIEGREFLEDERQVLLRAGKVVVPRRAEAAASGRAEVGLPAQSRERELAVLGEAGPVRSARRVKLHGRSGGRHDDYGGDDTRPLSHAVIIPD
jgi:hypothetical protein